VIWILGDVISILQNNGISVFSYAIQRGDVGWDTYCFYGIFQHDVVAQVLLFRKNGRKMIEVANAGVDGSSSLKWSWQ
jgi:hypothetical protein